MELTLKALELFHVEIFLQDLSCKDILVVNLESSSTERPGDDAFKALPGSISQHVMELKGEYQLTKPLSPLFGDSTTIAGKRRRRVHRRENLVVSRERCR